MPTYEEIAHLLHAKDAAKPSVPTQKAQHIPTGIDSDQRSKNRRKHIARVMRSFCATPEDYDNQLRKQEGTCGICLEPPADGESLCVDHNHNPEPGHRRRRGLLCHACNTAIGKLKDDPAVCERAAAYLKYWALYNAQ